MRAGFTYNLPSHHDSDITDGLYEYTMVLSEPVAQGYALPSLTEIALCCNTQPDQDSWGKVDKVHEDEEYIEIDQDFMANSVLPSIGCVARFIPYF